MAKNQRELRMLQARKKSTYETVDMGTAAGKDPNTEDENRAAELFEEFGDLCIVAGTKKLHVGE